jgi:hypothetical protein
MSLVPKSGLFMESAAINPQKLTDKFSQLKNAKPIIYTAFMICFVWLIIYYLINSLTSLSRTKRRVNYNLAREAQKTWAESQMIGISPTVRNGDGSSNENKLSSSSICLIQTSPWTCRVEANARHIAPMIWHNMTRSCLIPSNVTFINVFYGCIRTPSQAKAYGFCHRGQHDCALYEALEKHCRLSKTLYLLQDFYCIHAPTYSKSLITPNVSEYDRMCALADTVEFLKISGNHSNYICVVPTSTMMQHTWDFLLIQQWKMAACRYRTHPTSSKIILTAPNILVENAANQWMLKANQRQTIYDAQRQLFESVDISDNKKSLQSKQASLNVLPTANRLSQTKMTQWLKCRQNEILNILLSKTSSDDDEEGSMTNPLLPLCQKICRRLKKYPNNSNDSQLGLKISGENISPNKLLDLLDIILSSPLRIPNQYASCRPYMAKNYGILRVFPTLHLESILDSDFLVRFTGHDGLVDNNVAINSSFNTREELASLPIKDDRSTSNSSNTERRRFKTNAESSKTPPPTGTAWYQPGLQFGLAEDLLKMWQICKANTHLEFALSHASYNSCMRFADLQMDKFEKDESVVLIDDEMVSSRRLKIYSCLQIALSEFLWREASVRFYTPLLAHGIYGGHPILAQCLTPNPIQESKKTIATFKKNHDFDYTSLVKSLYEACVSIVLNNSNEGSLIDEKREVFAMQSGVWWLMTSDYSNDSKDLKTSPSVRISADAIMGLVETLEYDPKEDDDADDNQNKITRGRTRQFWIEHDILCRFGCMAEYDKKSALINDFTRKYHK